jgi:ATP-dependent Clp protease ATP-binding subunit ClpA
VDEVILFHRLKKVGDGPIVAIQLKRLEKLLADRKIDARWTRRAAMACRQGLRSRLWRPSR